MPTKFLGIIHEEMKATSEFIRSKLTGKVFEVRTTDRLENHPCAVTVPDMPSARHFIRTQSHQINEVMKYQLLQPKLEINPKHPIIKKLSKLRTTDPETAELLTKQVIFWFFVNFIFIHCNIVNFLAFYGSNGCSWTG